MAAVAASRHFDGRAEQRGTRNAVRLAKKAEMEKKKVQIQEIFAECDVDTSSSLDPVQMKAFLDKYAYLKMGKKDVTEEAVAYVIKLAVSESGQEEISEKDIVAAVGVWETLAGDQEKIASKFDEFDKDSSGMLSPDQVQAMLTWMNGGEAVTSEEVDWVIQKADFSKEGSLRRDEISAAVSVWYLAVTEKQEKKSGICSIL